MSEIKEIYLHNYTKPAYSIESINLEFDLFEEYAVVTSSMKIQKSDEAEKHLRLDSIDLELVSLSINGLELDDSRYIIESESLTILNVPAAFSIKIINKIYPQNNTELEGLYKSGDIFCTQNEPEGFRRITPYLDRPDVMSVFTTTVIADKSKYPVLLSNGNKKESLSLDNERHSVTWFDPHKKPSYLFALVAGDLGSINDAFVTASGENVELNIYCDKGNESKCDHAMKSLKEAMTWDEEKYGREYDLEIYNIVAVDSFNMGAMENKGLNIFNSAYVLADTDTASDANFMGIQSVIAHEYFHNWTGNRITCRDWFQLTLKEGLTVFRDQCFSADLNSKEVQRIEDVKSLRERQFVEDASPTSHPIQPKSYISMNNFYTATIYEKGAEVIRMIHTLLGEENYRKATDLYFESFDGQAVTTDDFLWAMSEASGVDLRAFKNWYHQSGTPKLSVSESFCDGIYSLTLTQSVPNAVDGTAQKPFYYPLKIALLDTKGKEVVNEMIIISKETETFEFKGLSEKPVLSINRDFTAPIIIEQENVEFAFLIEHDTNSFIKYEATQAFAIETIESMMKGSPINPAFTDSFGKLLSLDTDLSYKALLLELPSVSTLMQRQEEVDFEPIYEAKEKLAKHLALVYEEKLLALYKENHQTDAELDSLSMGKRSLKNRVLRILSGNETQALAALTRKQYEESMSMSDRVVALDILENTHPEFASVAHADFYSKYKDQTLVMNKYFAILASSHRSGTLDRVQALQNDEVYDEKVPNLVRSLIGVFARNYKHFHSKDGHAYSFVADKIIEIDKINAQMASGLAGAFKIYTRMNKTNKELMKKELERIAATDGLSKNTFEIISKILK
ncbi:aminopeptidase N [Sulfurimonas sp. SAG-AH-194-C21]|nr:aminopeptidase N [Sulfurimonas sp. SAG-AH-194-C21]MDF1882559.1 aminopeptidase N [Sulfurimonas sp. SAG-AH-194-C21]